MVFQDFIDEEKPDSTKKRKTVNPFALYPSFSIHRQNDGDIAVELGTSFEVNKLSTSVKMM